MASTNTTPMAITMYVAVLRMAAFSSLSSSARRQLSRPTKSRGPTMPPVLKLSQMPQAIGKARKVAQMTT